jgi:predicted permease
MWLTLRQSLRRLKRRPLLTGAGIFNLAVGIGCALACASVVNTVLFRAFPYRDSERLVLVWENNAKRGVGLTPTSVLNFQDLKAASSSFEDLGVFVDELSSIDGLDSSERATGYRLSAGLLDQAGVSPLLGRLFAAEDNEPGANDVVVLSHALWTRRYGADPTVIGKTMRLTGVPHTIVGVMPAGFVLPPVMSARLVGVDVVLKEADFWLPLKIDSLPERRDARFLFMLGRLRAGRSIEQSQAEATSIAARLAAAYPVDDFGLDFTVVALETQVLSNVRTLLLLLLLVGALVLIIAATNAAHLLLADALTMTGDTAVRSALGAPAWRLMSGLGTVSVVWCALATVGAFGIAAIIQAPVAAYTRANVPRLNDVKLDGTVALVAIAAGVALALATGFLPMMYARKNSASARSINSTPVPIGVGKWRRLFVVLQLTVAVIVLSVAAQLFRSADALSRVDPGFVADGVSVFELMPPESRYGTQAALVDLERRLLERTTTVPGSERVAIVDVVPFGGHTAVINWSVENHVPKDAVSRPRAALRAISASYFDVLSIPTIEGRRFAFADEDADRNVVVVNDAFVRTFIPDGRAIGRRIKRGEPDSRNPWMTVIGVVGAVRSAGLTLDPQPEVFVPYVRGGTIPIVHLLVKTRVPSQTLAPSIAEAIHRVDAQLAPTTVTDMRELVARAVAPPYFYARVFGVLAAVALILSLAGTYGVAVLGVSARSDEIAIRSCIGAQPGDIVRLILRETSINVGCGVTAGAVGAWLVQRRIAAFVYGLESVDWLAIGLSAFVLAGLAIAIVYIATRRVLVLRPLDLLKNGAGALA